PAYVRFDALAYAPDGKTLAVAEFHNLSLWNTTTNDARRRLKFSEGPHDWAYIFSIAFSPDGSTVAAVGRSPERHGRVRVWDTLTGKEHASLTAGMNSPPDDDGPSAPESFKESFVYPHISFSPDGRLLTRTGRATTLAVWEAATGKKRCILVGHKHSTFSIAFSPDSRTLASSDWDNTIRLWDLETGKKLHCLTGHRGAANSLVFTSDGNTLISS